MLYRFNANLFRLPQRLVASEAIALRGVNVAPLREDDGRAPTFDEFLPVSFEETMEALTKLPRMDAEPDGFFVLTGGAGADRWQLDGHLFDFGGRMHRVGLHGDCPQESLDALLACLGWPETSLAFELVMEGVALDETSFRSWAVAAP